MTAEPPKIVVGLCGCLDGTGGLDLGAVRRKLDESLTDVQVEVVPDLCGAPDQTRELASRTGADRLVLGLCTRDASAAHEFQSWTRKAGLDPFALELVDLRRGRIGQPPGALSRATSLLVAAVARVRVFAGSNPEQLKLQFLSFEQRRSRRALFALPPTTYRPVPSIARASCLGGRRCALCVSACPTGAIEASDGSLVVDRDRCESCGLCVTACPVSAISCPGSSLPQYEAQIAALLAQERPGILFACGRALAAVEAGADGRGPLRAGWLPVEVPCLGMVTPGWMLQALAAGAPAAALLSCGEHCRFGRDAALCERADYVQSVLGLLGEEAPAERVRVLPAEREQLAQGFEAPPPLRDSSAHTRPRGRLTLVEPAATAEAVLELAADYGAPPDLSLVHVGSPLGLLRLREDTCTICGACAEACPTGALVNQAGEDGCELSHDASRCVACGRCVTVCPEAAMDTVSVAAATDLAALRRGRVALKHDHSTRCRRCGGPVAPAGMLDRIRTLLEGEGSESLLAVLSELCVDCRGLGEATPPGREHTLS